jgi:hypothetical protein
MEGYNARFLVLALVLIGLILGLCPARSDIGVAQFLSGCSVIVSESTPLQSVIDNAMPDSVICLRGATYPGPVHIGKALTLFGEGATIRGSSSTVVDLDCAAPITIRLEDLTITGSAIDGIIVSGRCDLLLKNVTLTSNAAAGLIAGDGTRVQAEASAFTHNGQEGVRVIDTARISLLYNRISNNKGYGLRVSGPERVIACQGNTFVDNAEAFSPPETLCQ